MRFKRSPKLSYGPSRHVLRKTGLTGFEPATSGVTDRHSNQTELQPPLLAPADLGRMADIVLGAAADGAYWTRTSDLYDVNVAL